MHHQTSNTLTLMLRTTLLGLTFFFVLVSPKAGFAQSSACMAQGASLPQAKDAYALQCAAPRADCDPREAIWVCSSQNITSATQITNALVGQPSSADDDRPSAPVLGSTDYPTAGNQNGKPICLVDTNTANGYGYENNRSCIVIPGVTASRTNPLLNNRICSPWMEIGYGNYVLQNNVWNSGGVYSDNWSQCIELGGSAGNYVARWDYNWLDRTQGEEYAVKSYPQVYYGRKTQYNRSGTVEETGLPVVINQLPEIRVDFKYSESGNAERNVALESFLHTSCETSDDNKYFEMMVWVDKLILTQRL